jgi:UDP-glucuronate 4-epimerase
MKRDFTYIDDIVSGIREVLKHPPKGNFDKTKTESNPALSPAPYRIYNIGNNSPVRLMDFIEEIEKNIGIEAKKAYKPIQLGDVPASWADVTDLMNDFGFKPSVSIQEGVRNFIDWYCDYYNYKK